MWLPIALDFAKWCFVIKQYDKAKLYVMTLLPTCISLLTVDITVFFNETIYDASDVGGPEVPLLFLSNPSSINTTVHMIITDLLGRDIACLFIREQSYHMTNCYHRKLEWIWWWSLQCYFSCWTNWHSNWISINWFCYIGRYHFL